MLRELLSESIMMSDKASPFVSLVKDEQFAVLQLQKVLLVDSLATTHPVFMPVYHPDEINEIFDSISYNKVCFLHFFQLVLITLQ